MAGHQLHLAGTGTFAAEVLDWAGAAGFEVAGLIEMSDSGRVGSRIHSLAVRGIDDAPAGGRAVLATGGDRRVATERLLGCGWASAGLLHPSAIPARSAVLAPSATVGPLCVVGACSEIGKGAVLNRGCLVGHHTAIGSYATLNPGTNVGGNTEIGAGAFLGMGCVVRNGVSVGADATIAAGAVVIDDVAPGERVQGVPARRFKG